VEKSRASERVNKKKHRILTPPSPSHPSSHKRIASARDAAPHPVRHLAAVQLKNCVTRGWRGPGPGPASTATAASTSAITNPEKERLRPGLVSLLLSEPDPGVAAQAALALSRAARIDWPRAWPGLIAEIAAAQQQDGSLASRRARLGLHSVLRELAGKRLAVDRRAFAGLAADLLPPVWASWCAETQALVASLPASLEAGLGGGGGDAWLLGLKVVRRLLVSGFQGDGASLEPAAAVVESLPVLIQALQAVCAALAGPAGSPAPSPSAARAAACDAALSLLKSVRKLAEAHPWACLASGTLPAAMAVCGQLMGGADRLAGVASQGAASRSASPPGGQPPSPSWPATAAAVARSAAELATQAMVCVKVALDVLEEAAPGALAGRGGGGGQAPLGRTPPRLAGVRSTVAPQAAALATTLLGPDGGGLAALARTLVDAHLPLTAADIDEWAADAEAWAVGAASSSAAWRDAPRGAAEVLLTAAARAAPATLGPQLVSRLQAACAACPAGQARGLAAAAAGAARSPLPPPVLEREAAAAAVCVAAYDLHDAFPKLAVSGWVRTELLPDLIAFTAAQPASSSLPLDPAAPLARRAALALAAFVAALGRGDRAASYGPLADALSAPDAAVALAAAAALRTLVDDWGFEEADFVPVAPAVVKGLGRMLGAAGCGAPSPPIPALIDLDAQAQAAGVLHLVIDRLAGGAAGEGGGGCVPANAALAACVPPLLAILPAMWAGPDGAGGRPRGAGAAPLLRLQALTTLARLVNALGPDFFSRADPGAAGRDPSAGVLLPMLAASLDPASPDATTLAGDGLALFVAALRNAPSGAPCGALLALLPAAAALAAGSTDAAPAALCAAASAALLAPDAITACAPALESLFTSLAPALNARGSLMLYAAADAVGAACPGGSGWPLLRGLACHAASGLLARPCDMDTTVAGAAAALLARLALHSPSAAAEVAAEAVATSPDAAAGVAGLLAPGAHPVAALAEALAARYDTLPASGSRRLVAHALCALLGLGAPGMAVGLPTIAAAVTAAVYEEEGAAGGGGAAAAAAASEQFLFDALTSAVNAGGSGSEWAALDDSADAAPESDRRAALRGGSPTARRRVGAALREAAAAAAAGPCGAEFGVAASGLDPQLAAAMNAAMRG